MRTLHLALRVADLRRSVRFYTHLGYEVVGEVCPEASVSMTMLKLPADEHVSLELVHDTNHGSVDPSGLSHFVISVRSLDRTLSLLAARGIQTDLPTAAHGSDPPRTAWVTDPDGFRVELVQWPEGHPPGMTGHDFTPPALRTTTHPWARAVPPLRGRSSW